MAENTDSRLVGKIVRILDDHTVVINLGSQHFVGERMRFGIWTPEVEIADGDASLGTYRRLKGIVVVSEVHPLFCVAQAPAVKEQIVEEEPPLWQLGGGRTRKKVVLKRELNVDPSYVEEMPTGDEIRRGDTVEQVVQRDSSSLRSD